MNKCVQPNHRLATDEIMELKIDPGFTSAIQLC